MTSMRWQDIGKSTADPASDSVPPGLPGIPSQRLLEGICVVPVAPVLSRVLQPDARPGQLSYCAGKVSSRQVASGFHPARTPAEPGPARSSPSGQQQSSPGQRVLRAEPAAGHARTRAAGPGVRGRTPRSPWRLFSRPVSQARSLPAAGGDIPQQQWPGAWLW
jgi:hypothetical protein